MKLVFVDGIVKIQGGWGGGHEQSLLVAINCVFAS
jgi:hypothetical protein